MKLKDKFNQPERVKNMPRRNQIIDLYYFDELHAQSTFDIRQTKHDGRREIKDIGTPFSDKSYAKYSPDVIKKKLRNSKVAPEPEQKGVEMKNLDIIAEAD